MNIALWDGTVDKFRKSHIVYEKKYHIFIIVYLSLIIIVSRCVLIIALSKYTFILTLKLIISGENVDSTETKYHQFFTNHVN